MNLHSYPSIFTLGHAAVSELLHDDVIVEEKVDGSQLSFGVRKNADGVLELAMRSKGAEINTHAPEGMFSKAVETARELEPLLREGWTYRGEYLAKPKHNSLAYDRAPAKHVILFDINPGHEEYLSRADKEAEAARLGLECVPALFVGRISSEEKIREFLATTSVLGGQMIEGVVIKPLNYDKFGKDKKCLLAKFVSEAFKETHAREWTKENPKSGDVLDRLGAFINSQARWQKAIQHLGEAGKLEHSPRDIALLIHEVPDDIRKECEDELKAKLFEWAWPHLRRAATRGMPEWYKEQLLKRQFETATAEPTT